MIATIRKIRVGQRTIDTNFNIMIDGEYIEIFKYYYRQTFKVSRSFKLYL